jgi:hypothetical protein
MSRPVRVAVFGGAGTAGTQIIKSLASHGAAVVAAIEVAHLGEDVGTHAGIGPLGVAFEDDAAAALDRSVPDIAVFAIATGLAPTAAAARWAIERGVDALTIAEDAFYPTGAADRKLAAEIDTHAKANGATFFATGMQDLFWQQAMTLFAAACNDIVRVSLTTTALQDGLSQAVLDSIYAGRTVEEFDAAAGAEAHEMFEGLLNAVAADLGLEPTRYEGRMEPMVSSVECYSEKSKLVIGAGRILGTREVGVLHTAEGVVLEAEFQAKLAEPGDADGGDVRVFGSNPMSVRFEGMSGFENTAAIVANRVLNVLAARPGYLLVQDMPRLTHHAHLAI